MSKSDNQRRAGSPAPAQIPAALPTPPKSSSTAARRSPRSGSNQLIKDASPLRSPTSTSPTKTDPASKKRKSFAKQWSPASEDVLCPICDDVCTCSAELSRDNGQGSGSGSASGWSSPIIIKDRKSSATTSRVRTAAPPSAKPKASAITAKSTKKSPHSSKNQRKERRIDRKADAMAQLVLSEYYFSTPAPVDDISSDDDVQEEGIESGDEYVLMELDQSASDSGDSFSDMNSSSDLDEIIFELSEDEDEVTTLRMKELLMSKVNSVIGPNAVAWAGDSEDSDGSEDSRDYDEPRLYMFDPTDAANLVVHLPLPRADHCDDEEEERGPTNLANLTPQVLAAISAASKTLTAATQHYTHNPTVPFSRDQAKHVAFVIEPEASTSSFTAASFRFDDLIDMTRLHGSSPPTPAAPMSQFMSKRWDRIPISSFRKRRLSVPRNVLPPNAIKQPPPELPNERFAQLHISEPSPLSCSLTDLLIIMESEDPNSSSSSQRERRSTIQVTPGQHIESLEDDPGYYWPLGGDEDLHWLGEHFRTNLA